MKKKITIVSVCALVVLVSMTSSLFAGLCTTSFKYDFWNANPWTGTSYGVTYLKDVLGISMQRTLTTKCKVYMTNGTYSNIEEDTIADTYATYCDIHAQSNSYSTVGSWHYVYLHDGYSTDTSKEMSGVKDCHKTGTLTPVDPY